MTRTWVTGSPSITSSSVPAISSDAKVHPGTCAEPQSSVGTTVGSPSVSCREMTTRSTLCESNGQRSTYPSVMRRSDCGAGISSCAIVNERGPSLSLTRRVSGSVSRPVSSEPIGPNERTSRVATRRSPAASTDSGEIARRTASDGGSSVQPWMFATRSLIA